MGRISRKTIEEVIQASAIEEVIGDYVGLRRRGSNYVALCPFHNEKTPSFVVSPTKGIFKCFGCGKAGGVIQFLMDHEQLSFSEAVRLLAKRYGIAVEEEGGDTDEEAQRSRDERESLYTLFQAARAYYTRQLDTDMGKSVARSYLRQRGIRQDTIQAFGLGYAGEDPKGLTTHLLSMGYQADILRAIRQREHCIVVEGYMDVLIMHQCGLSHVVAASGTAITEEHARLLRRHTDRVVLLFDADEAGIRAALRAIDILLSQNLHPQVVLLPEGEDPDSFLRNRGVEAFEQYLHAHIEDFLPFKARILLKGADNNPLKKANALKEVVQSLAYVSDIVRRHIYIQECARIFDMEESVVVHTLHGILRRMAKRAHLQRIHDEDEVPVEAPEASVPQPFDAQSDYYKERALIEVLMRYGHLLYDKDQGITIYDFILKNIREYSPNWETKYMIYSEQAKRGDALYREIARKAVLHLKLAKISRMLADNQREIEQLEKQGHQPEILRTKIAVHERLIALRKQIADELGIVVS